MPYDYSQLEALNTQNTGTMLEGQLPPEVINQIAQRAAERGVSTGMPAGPNMNAAYLSAIGRSSLDLQKQGEAAFSNTRTAELEKRRIEEQARQFLVEMTFKEKELAQQLGISEQQFALEKARLAEQARQADQANQLGVSRLSLEEKQLAQTLGLTEEQYALQRAQMAQQGSQFSATLGQNASQFSQTQAAAERQRQLDEQFRRDQLAQQAATQQQSTLASLVSPQPWWTAANQAIASQVTGVPQELGTSGGSGNFGTGWAGALGGSAPIQTGGWIGVGGAPW